MLGAGVDVRSSNGHVVVSEIFAATDLTNADVFGIEDDAGNPGTWSIAVRAICASITDLVSASVGPHPAGKGGLVVCPAVADRPTGTGAELDNAFSEVRIDDLFMSDTDSTTTALPRPGITRDWTLTSYVICSSPPPNSTVVTASEVGSGTRSVTVTCPAGRRVLGAGGQLTGAAGVVLTFAPNPSLTSVTATGTRGVLEVPPGDWELRAYAVCGTAPPGLQLVTATSESASDQIAQITANCPAAKHVIGIGATTAGGGGILLDGVRPKDTLTGVVVTAFEEFGVNVANQWQVSAYAICINR